MQSNFFSILSRMRYINRWGLMRNARQENLSEHTLDVAIITHALCVISNTRLNNSLDANKAAMLAMFHDASEIVTGDLPTPIKYLNKDINSAYKNVEKQANETILAKLPTDLRGEYEKLFYVQDGDEYLWQIVKAADKISALIKCIEEEKSGNTEFSSAKCATQKSLKELKLKEVEIFMDEFFEGYNKTLDEVLSS